jgi:hypothetical protein
MTNIGRIAIILFLSVLATAIGIAQPPATDVEGSQDHLLVSRYSGLVITDYATAEFDEFTLPLGKVEEEKPVKSQHLGGVRSPASSTLGPSAALSSRSIATMRPR